MVEAGSGELAASCSAHSPFPIPHSCVPVAAAVLRNADGGILLTQRRAAGDLPGLWEFPGGKLEPGETVEVALARELREELGIDVGASRSLIDVPCAYPHKRILLHVREVEGYRGDVEGREGQALAWVAPERLRDYPMPGADRPVVAALLQPSSYLVTPEPGSDQTAFLAALAGALDAGVERVQLRAKRVPEAALRRLASAVADRVAAHGGELLLNSGHPAAVDLARDLGCGLHLTAADLRAMPARPDWLEAGLAASCHDAEELALAQRLGCDFVVLGPLAVTASHADARPLGWQGFAALRETTRLPVYALGGLDASHLAIARSHGAQGIAAIRGLWPDPAVVA